MGKPKATLAEIFASGRNLLNENEAATLLYITVGTLRVWRSTGRYEIPYVKIGRLVRYKRADLEAWIESRTRDSHCMPGQDSVKARSHSSSNRRRTARGPVARVEGSHVSEKDFSL
jgi:excisionase family DNA binding protein